MRYSVPCVKFSAWNSITFSFFLGLCLDGGQSFTSKLFKTRIMQFLGRISMSLYLVHEPLIFWIKCLLYGKLDWINGMYEEICNKVVCIKSSFQSCARCSYNSMESLIQGLEVCELQELEKYLLKWWNSKLSKNDLDSPYQILKYFSKIHVLETTPMSILFIKSTVFIIGNLQSSYKSSLNMCIYQN